MTPLRKMGNGCGSMGTCRWIVARSGVVAAGDALLAPSITRRLIAEFTSHARRAPDPTAAVAPLTGRERDVLLGLARGRANAEIARELYLGDATVKTHVEPATQTQPARPRP